jgi:hypothetical protein
VQRKGRFSVEVFLIVFRAISVVIVVFWVWQLLTTRGKPKEWVPPMWQKPGYPRISRDVVRIGGALGIAAGIGLLLFSFLGPS